MPSVARTVCTIATALVLVTGPALSAGAETVLEALRGIERDLQARVGFYMHDLETDQILSYAAEDRFPLNSTFKLLVCGALLSHVETGQTALTDRVQLKDVTQVSYSPAIAAHISAGHRDVTLEGACRMMLSVSDNTAANIILAQIGGPDGLTAFLRSIGDGETRLDRWETALNEAVPGDPRDTTTPRAIAGSVQALLLGQALSPASKATLRDWLADHSVADALFRAALPPEWQIDDRTGAGGFGSRSIVAILYPPDRKPMVAALFLTETEADLERRNTAAARVGAAIVNSTHGE